MPLNFYIPKKKQETSLKATLVQNYDPATYSLSDGGEV